MHVQWNSTDIKQTRLLWLKTVPKQRRNLYYLPVCAVFNFHKENKVIPLNKVTLLYGNSSQWLLLKVCKLCEYCCLHFSSFKETLHQLSKENYLITIKCGDKLSRKKTYLRKILDLDYEFGLQLLDFTAFRLGNTWTVI